MSSKYDAMLEARFYISQSNPLYLRNFQKIIKKQLPALQLTFLKSDKTEILCQALSEKPLDFFLLGAAVRIYEDIIKDEKHTS